MQTLLSRRPPSVCPSGQQGSSSCPKPLLLLCHLDRKVLSANMGILLHAFLSCSRKTISFFQSLINGSSFRSAEDTGSASSCGGGLKLLYVTTERFSLLSPLLQSTWPHLVAMQTGWDPGTTSQNGMSKSMAEHPVGIQKPGVPLLMHSKQLCLCYTQYSISDQEIILSFKLF